MDLWSGVNYREADDADVEAMARCRLADPDAGPADSRMAAYFRGEHHPREALVDGFVDFCENARVHAFEERDHQIDVVADTAVARFAFEMVYEREGQAYRSTGRDLWVFEREGGEWRAVWRTMLDATEEPGQEEHAG